jgi:GntP family gluconate:H+ symporter
VTPDGTRLWIALGGVIVLILLVVRGRLHAFLALTMVSLGVGPALGLEPVQTVRAFGEGVGGVLRGIAVVVGLGSVLGKLLAESGGAEVLAHTLIRAMGRHRLPWAMLVIGFVVGLPTWFTVGLVLLMPVVLAVRGAAGVALMPLGLPMLAGLALAHGLVPPHPGPMAAIGTLGALAGGTDAGRVILLAIVVAVPVGLLALGVAGPLARHIPETPVPAPASLAKEPTGPERRVPGFGLTLATILLPLGLMLLATVAGVALPPGQRLRRMLEFAGDPVVAMVVGVLVACWSLGTRCGFDRARLAGFTEECLGPVAAVLLVVGAGGGFSKVLAAAGVGDAVAAMARHGGVSPLVLGWGLAAAVRVATGSSTVGITMAAGMVAPLAAAAPGTSPELLVVAMGAGSLFLSHVNDGGFWFVKEYFQLSVAQTLRTWSVLVSVVAVAALPVILLLDWLRGLV